MGSSHPSQTGDRLVLRISPQDNVAVAAATIEVGVGGTQSTGANWTLATDTGVITFASGSIPATGQAVTWGGEFDTPVRIDAQEFNTNYQTCNIITFNLPLIEIIP